VDGFHPTNLGLLAAGSPRFVPARPSGSWKLIEHEEIGVQGRHAVVVGRSNIVGKPMALLLLQKGATVTICKLQNPRSGSDDRAGGRSRSGGGQTKLVTAGMVKPGAVVIDVGITRLADGKLTGTWISRACSNRFVHHAGARRSRPHDDRDAAREHGNVRGRASASGGSS